VEASRPTAEGETPSGQPAGCRRYCRDWESEKTGKQISLKAADMKKENDIRISFNEDSRNDAKI
jgi:hypothetical protein